MQSLKRANVQSAHAHVVSDIEIQGNARVGHDAIMFYMEYEKGKDYTALDLDLALKKLFKTGFFADVHLEIVGKKLVVNVKENPVVWRIAIEGDTQIDDQIILKEIQLKTRHPFHKSLLKADIEKIKSLYRIKGFFSADVKPQLIYRDQNRVDVILKIAKGAQAKVKKIIFLGHKAFKSDVLRSVLHTQETRWYRFFSSDDIYDPDRLLFDQEKLRQFYLQHGYVDFSIKSAVAELSNDQKSFYVTLTLNEGLRYKVEDVTMKTDIEGVDLTTLQSPLKKGQWYTTKDVEQTEQNMTQALGDQGFPFIYVHTAVNKVSHHEGYVTVHFDVVKGQIAYIRHIEIHGNNRTNDDVIRRELRLHEGDSFSVTKLKDSERRIRNLGFFKKVNISHRVTERANEIDLAIDIEEEPRTGQLSVAGGYGSDVGAIFEAGAREENVFGKGQTFDTKFRLGKKIYDIDVTFTEPYFLNRHLSATVGLFNNQENNLRNSDFRERNTGGNINFGYELSDNLYQNIGYLINHESLKVTAQSSILNKKARRFLSSALTHRLVYDKLDHRLDPKKGYILSMSNKFTGFGGNVRHHSHTLNGAYYTPTFSEDVILSLFGETSIIHGIGQDVKISDRFSLGGDQLRGFEFNGIGPRDSRTGEPLRGQRMVRGSVEVTFPLGLPEEFGIKGASFVDFGTLWHPAERGSHVALNKGLRFSAGFCLMWKSPFGPLRFNFARALRKVKGDETRSFLFGYSSKI